MRSFFTLLVVASWGLLALFACEQQNDAAPDASQPEKIDASSDSPEGERAGLFVDDEMCVVAAECQDDRGTAPVYAYGASADCPTLGRVLVDVLARPALPYPQPCGLFTTVRVVMLDGGEFWADDHSGSCTLTIGPTIDSPSTPLSLTATVVGGPFGRPHALRQRSGPLGSLPPPDAGGWQANGCDPAPVRGYDAGAL